MNLASVPDVVLASIAKQYDAKHVSGWMPEAIGLMNRLATGWEIELGPVLVGGATSLCASGTDRDGQPVVVKVSPTDRAALELAGMLAWGGKGLPRVLHYDLESFAYAMPYLTAISDRPTMVSVHELAAQFHIDPDGRPFTQLRQTLDRRVRWAHRRAPADSAQSYFDDLERAGTVIDRLCQTVARPTLVHGDLQNKNLINTAAGLTAIDPWPSIGDPLFDAALWFACGDHDEPLVNLIDQYPAWAGSDERARFAAWAWALSVIERNPNKFVNVAERQEFIDSGRHSVSAGWHSR